MIDTKMRRLLSTVAMSCIVATAGCSVYSTSSGHVDAALRRVNVPFLQNATAEPNIEIELTEAIIAAIQDDNTLKIVGPESAQTELTGTVVSYRLKQAFSSAAGANLQVDEYQVQITVELTLRRLDTGEAVFSRKRLSGTGNYRLDDPATSETTARDLAAAEIVRGVLGLIVEDW